MSSHYPFLNLFYNIARFLVNFIVILSLTFASIYSYGMLPVLSLSKLNPALFTDCSFLLIFPSYISPCSDLSYVLKIFNTIVFAIILQLL